MSSLETSSPVSASTFAYLMRWPVFLLIWLKLIFSESEVAGYKRREKPFQLARGTMRTPKTQNSDSRRSRGDRSDTSAWVFLLLLSALSSCCGLQAQSLAA